MPVQTPQHPPQPAGVTAPLHKTPLRKYRLTVEDDPKPARRLKASAFATAASIGFGLVAWGDVAFRHPGEILDLGLGRIAGMMARHDLPLPWLIAALEAVHLSGLCAIFAVTIWFGATQRSLPLPGEMVHFHRRQSPWVAANLAVPGGLGLLAGQLLSSWGLGLLAAPLEVVCTSMICLAAWVACTPEARLSLSVIVDANAGWGNRIVLSGGMFRRHGRVTITKDQLISANARDFGGLEMVAGARTLKLRFLREGVLEEITVPGISPDPEVGVLASFLNTRFRLGLTPVGLDQAVRLGRLPLEAQSVIDTDI